MTKPIESIVQLFDRAGAMAHERLREVWGDGMVDDLLADPDANVRVTFDLHRRRVLVMVRWPKRISDEFEIPCMFHVPAARG